MALHRDIFWIGRQWTVTGFGIQACDQKNYATFDIEANRLWEAGALDKVREQGWLNSVDFEKALILARQRYPAPPSAVPTPEASVLGLIETLLKEPSRKQPFRKQPLREDLVRKVPDAKAMAGEPRKPVGAGRFAMRISRWPAKFVPSWRIRIGR